MNFKIFSALIFLFLCFKIQAFEEDFVLRGGFSIVEGRNNALEDEDAEGEKEDEDSEDEFIGFGVNSTFGYRWKFWEFQFASHIFFGKIDDFFFETSNTRVQGSGRFRHVSFSPQFRYNLQKPIYKKWVPYVFLGPVWSLQTINLDKYSIANGSFRGDDKFNTLSRGAMIAVGVEEKLPYKQMHSTYLEVLFSYQEAYKTALIDASDNKDVELIESSNPLQEIRGTFVMFNMGIIVF